MSPWPASACLGLGQQLAGASRQLLGGPKSPRCTARMAFAELRIVRGSGPGRLRARVLGRRRRGRFAASARPAQDIGGRRKLPLEVIEAAVVCSSSKPPGRRRSAALHLADHVVELGAHVFARLLHLARPARHRAAGHSRRAASIVVHRIEVAAEAAAREGELRNGRRRSVQPQCSHSPVTGGFIDRTKTETGRCRRCRRIRRPALRASIRGSVVSRSCWRRSHEPTASPRTTAVSDKPGTDHAQMATSDPADAAGLTRGTNLP